MPNRLRDILLNLICKEQCGFIAICSLLDNILVVQMVSHSIENDFDFDCGSFVKLVTKSEVYRTLCFFLFRKSLGIDGLNVDFYQIFWHDVGSHLFEAINYFFGNSVLPKS